MKKILCLLSVCVLICGIFAGCGDAENKTDNGKISIVSTVFPQYDWTRQILGDFDGAELSMLIDTSSDMHSFEPTADDIIKIADCDMFIYIGGQSDKWVEDALKSAVNKDMIVINLMEVLGDSAKHEETVEGMQHTHAHDENCEDEHLHENNGEYDEHIWLSLKNAKICSEYICNQLCILAPEQRASFEANLDAYLKSLDTLDNEYAQYFNDISGKKLLFADRFPFLYLAKDYSFEYYAAFSGCSSESEASFETITFLAKKLDDENINAVFTIENSSCNIANTVINASQKSNVQILTLDSMQSSANGYIENNKTYVSVMEDNLEVFKNAPF